MSRAYFDVSLASSFAHDYSTSDKKQQLTFTSDSIKSAARRQAWYNQQDGDNKTYNFFGRLNSNPRRHADEEDGAALSHTMSSPIDQRDHDPDMEDFGGAKKAGTFPAGPTGNMPPRAQEPSQPMKSPNEKDEHGLGSNSSGSARPPSESQQTDIIDRSVGPEAGPRKRKMRKFIPFMSKKDDEDEQDLQRADTSESRKKKHPKLTIGSQLKAVFASWINIMLVFVPVGIALHEVHSVSRIVVFIVNFLAIIPLAAMLSFATEELALYVGETLGGLLNASFGNAVELIVSIIALAQKKIVIVQTSLVSAFHNAVGFIPC